MSILNLGKGHIRAQPAILELGKGHIRAQPAILELGKGHIRAQPAILELGRGHIRAQPAILELGKVHIRVKPGLSPYLPNGFQHGGKRRSVVLIGCIDNAPRDFPNDLIKELEGMFFRIPELANQRLEAERSMAPIVFITSNSTRSLPDAFCADATSPHGPFFYQA